MIKNILCPLDPSEYSLAARNVAAQIATMNNASIAGIVVLDIPGIERSLGAMPPGTSYYAHELQSSKVEVANKHVDSLLEAFKEHCSERGCSHVFHRRQGEPSDKVLEHSKFYDLLVIGERTYFHFSTSDEPGDSFEDILDESVTPILAVPKNIPDSVFGNGIVKTVIAFDGSMPSARALQRFAQFQMFDNYEVKLVLSSDNPRKGRHYLDDAETYLMNHGFTKIEKIYTRQEIISFINENYIGWAELFVVGAHSRRSILDFMVGSLTKHLIKKGAHLLFIGQ